jgi:hypothetical protein
MIQPHQFAIAPRTGYPRNSRFPLGDPPPPAGTPAISSRSGTFAHGEEVILSGADFGGGDRVSELTYDDFNRSPMSTSATIGTWQGYFSSLGNPQTTDTVQRHARSPRVLAKNFDEEGGNYRCAVQSLNSVLSRSWFAQYWLRLVDFSWGTTSYVGPSGNTDDYLANVKVFRVWNPGSVNENFVMATRHGGDGVVFAAVEYISNYAIPAFTQSDVSKPDMSDGNWHCMQLEFVDSSAANVRDAWYRFWFDGQLKMEYYGFLGKEDYDVDKRMYEIGYYNSWGPGQGTTKAPNWMYMHDAYCSPTLARVELGNNSVYGDCTAREIQIPLAWSSTEISIQVNAGAFADGASVYLFVVDELGTPSAGFPVSIVGE